MMTKIFQLILIAGFLILVFVPNLFMTFGWDAKLGLGPPISPFPNLKTMRLDRRPAAIQLFYNEHFGFRNFMIRNKTEIERNLFQITNSKNVLIGKTDFYFLNPIDPKDPKASYKTVFFTQEELATIKDELERETLWMKQRSIPFFIVIVPDKEVIYPEYFPYPNHILTNYKLDQLENYLEESSTVRLLDLRKVLLRARSENKLLYRKDDTHWNQYGAFLAYQEIMRNFKLINPNVYVPLVSDFEIKTENSGMIGDLTRIVETLEGPVYQIMKVIPKANFPGESKKLKKVFIYGDSFATSIIRGEISAGLAIFFPLNFEQTYTGEYVSAIEQNQRALSPLEYAKIEAEKPDLVIRETAQRNLRILLGPDYTIF